MTLRTSFIAFLVAGVATVALAQQPAKPATAPATPAVSPATQPDEVVARVDGVEIKRNELDAAVKAIRQQYGRMGGIPDDKIPQLEHDVLDELISRQLVVVASRGHEPEKLDDKVKEFVERFKVQAGGDEGFKKALEQGGLTEKEYLQKLREELMVQEFLQGVVEREVKIAPESVKEMYDKNQDKFQQPETVRASHILIRVPQDATAEVKKEKRTQIDAARSLVKNGEKFSDVAKKFSEDPGSKLNGGDLGFFARKRMVPEFDEVAFTLKTNEVSEVITTQFGYHVLVVTDKKPARLVPLDEAKTDIERYLRRQKGSEVVADYLKKLKEKAKIEVLLKPLPPVAVPAPTAGSSPEVVTPPVAAPKS
jgi:peptidyl-prolyl cis-trans isomerase C